MVDAIPAGPAGHLSTPFVGRERELAALREGLERALAGHGRLFLLVGEPGIGKSRTAEALLPDARAHGALALWGRCREWEGAPASWPWIQIMRRYLDRHDPEAVKADLADGARDILQILPDLEQIAPDTPERPPASPEQARFQLFDSMSRFLRSLSRRQPVVLVLDDLHWADRPSLLLLEFIAQDAHELSALLIGTYRNVELDRRHPLNRTLAELNRDPACRRLMLHGLSRDDIARYIEFALGRESPPALVDAVLEETDGNPFFVSEVVAWLASEGRLDEKPDGIFWTVRIPESIREAVENRLDQLSDETNEVLTAAAVIGREFPLPVLAHATRSEIIELLDSLDEAVQAGVIEELETPGEYRFNHALIQETLYAELTTSRRLRLHATIGEALETLHARNLPPYYSELAHHFSESALAGNADKAIDYATKAGDQAMERLAWEPAVALYQEALRLADFGQQASEGEFRDLLLSLAEAQSAAEGLTHARPTFLRAAELARQQGHREALARAALGYAGTGILTGADDPVVIALLQEAVTAARLHHGPAVLALALHARHVFLFTEGYASEGIEAGLRIGAEAVAAAERSGNLELRITTNLWHMVAPLLIGDRETVDAQVAILSRLEGQLKQPFYSYFITCARALHALLGGNYASAEQLTSRVRNLAPRTPHGPVLWWMKIFLLIREIGPSTHDELEATVHAVIHHLPGTPLESHLKSHRQPRSGRGISGDRGESTRRGSRADHHPALSNGPAAVRNLCDAAPDRRNGDRLGHQPGRPGTQRCNCGYVLRLMPRWYCPDEYGPPADEGLPMR